MPKTSLLGLETTTGKEGELLLVNGELKVSSTSSGVVGDKEVSFGGSSMPGVGVFAHLNGTSNYKALKVDSNGHLLTAVDSSADSIQILGNTNKDGTGTKYHVKQNADGQIETEITGSSHNPSQAFTQASSNLTVGLMATNSSNQYQQLRVNANNELMVSGSDDSNPSNITSTTSAAVATSATPSTIPKVVISGPESNSNPTLISPLLVDTDGTIKSGITAVDQFGAKQNITAMILNSVNRLQTASLNLINEHYDGSGGDVFVNFDTGLSAVLPSGALNIHDTFHRQRLEDSANPISVGATSITNSTVIEINNVDKRSASGGGTEGAYKAKKMSISVAAKIATPPTQASIQIIGFSGNADVHNYDVVHDDKSQWTLVGQDSGVNVYSIINGSIDVLHDKYFVRIDNQTATTIPFYVNYYIGG